MVKFLSTVSRNRSPYGIRDMGGNIREFCRDWYSEEKKLKHVRGGAWGFSDVSRFRSAARDWCGWVVAITDTGYGFRLARAPGLR